MSDSKTLQEKLDALYKGVDLTSKDQDDKKILIRDKRAILNREKAQDPAFREKVRVALNDPVGKKERGEKISKALNTPKSKEKMSKSVREAMARPEVKNKQKKSLSKRWADPKQKEQASKISKEINSRPEVKDKQRKSALGRKASKETKAKMTATRTGKKHKDTTIAKMTRIFEGTNILTGEKIIAHGTKEIRELGFSQSMVSECVNGKRESCKGYTWKKIISHNHA